MVALLKTSPETATSLSLRAGKTELGRALATLARIADRKSSMPMLANILIRVGTDGAELVATDLNVSATLKAPAWGGVPGGIAVNAKSLADLVKQLPDGEITLNRSGVLGLRIASGAVDTTLIGAHDRDFPKVPSPGAAVFSVCDAQTLKDMIGHVAFSICNDDTRFHLCGILLECDGAKARMVTTDGHRLTRIDREWTGPVLAKGVIIPAKGAKEIAKLLGKGTCEIAVSGPCLFVRYAGWELAIKLIAADFPPYEQVIPKGHEKLVTIERKPLIDALKRAKAMTSDTRGVRLDVASGKLTLTSDDPDRGTASEVLTAESQWCDEGGKLAIGLNVRYLLDVLGEIDCSHVTLAFGAELAPVVIRSTHDAVEYTVGGAPFVAVVMPMRI